MGKKPATGVYQKRFNLLWASLAMCDARLAGEISPELVSGIIGCSEDYARRLIFERIRFKVKRF